MRDWLKLLILILFALSPSAFSRSLQEIIESDAPASRAELLAIPRPELVARIESEIKSEHGFMSSEARQYKANFEAAFQDLRLLSIILDRQIGESGLNPRKIQVFSLGGGMDGVHSFFNVLGTKLLQPDQFRHLPLSRGFFRQNPEAAREVIRKATTEALEKGDTIIVLDSFKNGESLNFVNSTLKGIKKEAGSISTVLSVGIQEGGNERLISNVFNSSIKEALATGETYKIVNIGPVNGLAGRLYRWPKFTLGKSWWDEKTGQVVTEYFRNGKYNVSDKNAIQSRLFSILWVQDLWSAATRERDCSGGYAAFISAHLLGTGKH